MTTELTSASETSPRPINQAAAVQAVLAAAQYHPCAPYFTEWAAFTEAVKENRPLGSFLQILSGVRPAMSRKTTSP